MPLAHTHFPDRTKFLWIAIMNWSIGQFFWERKPQKIKNWKLKQKILITFDIATLKIFCKFYITDSLSKKYWKLGLTSVDWVTIDYTFYLNDFFLSIRASITQ